MATTNGLKQSPDRSPKPVWAVAGQVQALQIPANVESALSQAFPGALPASSLLAKTEQALKEYGFTGENTIALCSTCRDEITRPLIASIDAIFGASFDTVGLGGVITCGVTGLKAGLSHAPVDAAGGKARYIFFAFSHVGVDSDGAVSKVKRPGLKGPSAACGAMVAALGQLQQGGLEPALLPAGKHDPEDPEFSIMKSRLARRAQKEGTSDSDVKAWGLPDITKAMARTITHDLENLISKAVSSEADYAVVTGVQIHVGTSDTHVSPDLSELVDYIYPGSCYAVVNGQRKDLHTSNGTH